MSRRVMLTGVDGSVWDLTDPNATVRVRRDPELWGSHPVSFVTERTVGGVGYVVRSARPEVRRVVLDVVINAATAAAVDVATEALAAALTSRARSTVTPQLMVSRPDAPDVFRVLPVVCPNAIVQLSTETVDARYRFARRVQFEAPGVYWLDETPTTQVFDLSAAAFEPVRYDAEIPYDAAIPYDGGLGVISLDVTGTVEAWPTWTVVGPATHAGVELLSDTLRPLWQLGDTPLAVGETLRIVTDPRARSVTVDGVRADGRLAIGADLFSLPPGPQKLNVTFEGTGAGSDLRASWFPRWQTC